MSHVVILHPETEALQRELERLRQRSSELYLKVEYMQFEEKQVLYSLYETQIGKLEFEEFQLKVEIQLLTYETKLVQSYINRNERINEGRIAEQVKFAQVFDKRLSLQYINISWEAKDKAADTVHSPAIAFVIPDSFGVLMDLLLGKRILFEEEVLSNQMQPELDVDGSTAVDPERIHRLILMLSSMLPGFIEKLDTSDTGNLEPLVKAIRHIVCPDVYVIRVEFERLNRVVLGRIRVGR